MKFGVFLIFLCLLAGCSKINELSPANTGQTEQTRDPVYDAETEVKVVVPWNVLL